MASVWSSLSNIPDPRTGNAQRHKLLDVLTIALVASICGAESCVDFADFARDREALFREFLELPGGPPSHDTFSRVFRLLDPAARAQDCERVRAQKNRAVFEIPEILQEILNRRAA